ncbi:DnaA ATPase domain-containing protein [Limimaricola hongkongensis]|uniref:Chromosomal replication initiator protein DnaA n=1 Tax=Limimaricola hongkongensis DSM 17492 TaxID=1122180 RepID=A0A017H9I7_9RHOB|nr:DnaA/Hda family protein [Limimaricola hongkongensis]EYD71021.1 Chromosomal replication initiator protein DnaA [Limimaricola hongkongensis DSM 17492]
MAWQLSLDLPLAVALGPDDFILSDANRAAHGMVTAMGWPEGKLALIGPPGSGKSHLARLWQVTSEAMILRAQDLGPSLPPPAPGAAIVVEDIDRLPREAEVTLFHLHNRLAASGGRLLMTADLPPARLDIALPDLASRLQATAVARIDDPDDRLLGAVLAKHFADRQLVPAAGVIPYLAARIERSFASAAAVVERLDRMALAEARPVNRALARQALGAHR